MHAMDSKQVQTAAQLIKDADSIVIAAGAGMGVDSGLPDFRGDKGFWRAYPALGNAGVGFKDIANPQAFIENPIRAWNFYGHRLKLYNRTAPHLGFQLLHKWCKRKPNGYAVYTSNVDDQFQKSGFSVEHVTECHGRISWFQCTIPCTEDVWPATDFFISQNYESAEVLPKCPECGALARPNVLMFNDTAWVNVSTQLQEDFLVDLIERMQCPVVIEIGAGQGGVRDFSLIMRSEKFASFIRINPYAHQAGTGVDCVGLPMGALDALTAIDELNLI
jgi:NAD-dependent SIR2 family protein deacetylase